MNPFITRITNRDGAIRVNGVWYETLFPGHSRVQLFLSKDGVFLRNSDGTRELLHPIDV